MIHQTHQVSITVSAKAPLLACYTQVLPFSVTSDVELADEAWERLTFCSFH